MQFSKAFVCAFFLALTGKALAEGNSTDSETEGVVGTSNGVEFPFSDDAIIEAVALGDDVAPIVLDDAVYFINTTIVEAEYAEHAAEFTKRDAEAWQWKAYRVGQPFYKRSAEADAEADADAWQWKNYRVGQPFYKRSAEADAEADAWQWKNYRVGQPFYKRSADAEAEANADAWQWKNYRVGQPFY
jgi:mating pheromone alpha-factor